VDLCFAEAYYQGAISEVIIRYKNVWLYISRGCVSTILRGYTISHGETQKIVLEKKKHKAGLTVVYECHKSRHTQTTQGAKHALC